MSNITSKNMDWFGAALSLETGRIARQASASVLVKYNETTVLVTVTTSKHSRMVSGEKKISTALMVNFLYKAYARCKIPAGFIKREGKPSEREVLASRVIDRSIRPLFPHGFSDDVHIVCNLLTHDGSVIPEIPSLIGVSAALNISEVPFLSTIVGANVGYNRKDYQLNDIPKGSMLDLIVAGTKDSVLMVESNASELTEEVMVGAIKFGSEKVQPVINFINDFSDAAGKKEKLSYSSETNQEVMGLIKDKCNDEITKAYTNNSKQRRCEILNHMKENLLSTISEENKGCAEQEIQKLEKTIVRNNLIENGSRIDGRKTDEIREIDIVTDILPRMHGSALFTRGGTQALVVITLGDHTDEQIVDGVDGSSREHFMLHYNFPPYSVGEATPLRPPGRREIGHGKLAWRALQAVLSEKDKFPYTVRVVSEITESDGSSSMATVCGTSLALMSGGVPIKDHVAGIAMGLIKEGNKHVILSDILGDEDHLGDMDFKIAGTKKGITALQMDIKITDIDMEIIEKALAQANKGRMHILEKMNSAIAESNKKLKDNAPQIDIMKINPDDITKVIGTGGKVIKNICEVSKAKVDIDNEGKILISAVSADSMKQAKEMLNSVLAVPKTGVVYNGVVTGVVDFGIFSKFLGDMEGLVHISEVQDDHVDSIEDIVKIGDKIKVVVLSVDRSNRVKLSMKYVDQESGEIFSESYSRAVRAASSSAPVVRKRKFPSNSSGGGGGGGNRPPRSPNSNYSRGGSSGGGRRQKFF